MTDAVMMGLISAGSTLGVALVGIIPTIITNRKKTEKSIIASNDAIDKRIDKLQTTLNAHIHENEDERARNQRYRILRFYDEMCEQRKHSESHFEDILQDIDEYEQYCDKHPEFKNSRGHVAMVFIRNAYGRIKANGGFLTHE